MTLLKTIKVSDKGQIAIPKSIRKLMALEKGDELVLLEIGGKILMEKSEKVAERMEEDFKDILKFSENSLKKISFEKYREIFYGLIYTFYELTSKNFIFYFK